MAETSSLGSGDEMVTVRLAAASAQTARPGLAEAADRARTAVRVWCQAKARAGWRGLAALSAVGAILGLLAGVLFAAVDPPLPASQTVISVSGYGVGNPLRMMTALVRSHQALAAAARLTRPVMSPAVLERQTQVSADPRDQLITIRIQARTSAQATSAVKAVITVLFLHEHLRHRFPPADYGATGAGPVPWQWALNLLQAGGLGALCGALLAAVLTVTLRPAGRHFRIR